MLGVYRTGSRHVVRFIHLNLTGGGGGAFFVCVWHREPLCWVCIAPEAARLDVYRTGSRHVECALHWEPPCCTLHSFV